MRTPGLCAVALSAVGMATPAFAQSNPNTQPPGAEGATPPITQPPPADRPLITQVPRPTQYILEGGMGMLGYLGGTGRLGPAWNVRFTADFSRRFAAEANYVGAVNTRSDNSGTLMYAGVDGDLRYNMLRADEAPVQPYLSAGLGFAAFLGPGGSAALVIPVAVGVERMLTERIKIGARFNLRPSFFENLAHANEPNPPSGTSWLLLVNAGGAF